MTQAVRLFAFDAADGPANEPSDQAVSEAPAADAQKVFSRTLSTPSAAPWDQDRAAGLEARVGAPLPLGEVAYRVRRIDAWRPGRPGRYAVFYARLSDVGDGLRTTVPVDGKPIKVRFVSPSQQRRRAAMLGASLLMAGIGVLAVFVAFWIALSTRDAAEARLSRLEQLSHRSLVEARAAVQQRRQARLLQVKAGRRSSIDQYLGDLGWLQANKVAGAHIDGIYWQQGDIGLEVRGDLPPVAANGRQLVRSQKPVRPGVWLWTLTPGGAAPQQAPAAGSQP